MNAHVWRCNSCHHLFFGHEINRDGSLLTCPDCGGMVLDVTHTKVGEAFLTEPKYDPLLRTEKTIAFLPGVLQ